MFFRNLVIFAFPANFPGLLPSSVADELSDLDARLGEARLKPVGPLELASAGFISPFGRDEEQLVHEMQDKRWISVGSEERILPGAVVNELLRKKLLEIEEREGYKPGGKTRKRIKDDLIHEVLPQAFVKPGRTDAFLDLSRGLIYVDTSSRRTGEDVVSLMRRALGSFPALPLNSEVAPRAVLTGWLAGEPLPEHFSLGEECELRMPGQDGAVVRIQHSDLQSDEVQGHLQSGLQCTRLALVYDDRVSFVFGEDLVVRKLKFLDGAVDQLENTEHEDLRAELDARFALMTGELSILFDALATAFKLTMLDKDGSSRTWDSTSGRATGARNSPSTVSPQAAASAGKRGGLGDHDELYDSAAAHVRKLGRVSISNIQRTLKIGYNRAAHLVEAMEHRGVVSPPDHRGDRQVL
jgi:recombination associated protein RdgC